MFLSIIIPVFNSEKYISNCLDSCLQQDIDESDYEIICIDDCSTDNSVELLKKYQEEYTNIIVIYQSENKGVSAARNAGLDCMRGDYCLFLDSDDYISDNCLFFLKQLILTTNGKAVISVGQFHFEEKGYLDRHQNNSYGCFYARPKGKYITNKIIPSIFASQLRFKENITYGEDEVFYTEMECFRPTFIYVEKPIYYYRRHNDSAMSLTPEKEKKQFDSVVNSAIYFKNKYGFGNENIEDFIRDRIQISFVYIDKQTLKNKKMLLDNMVNNGLVYPSEKSIKLYNIKRVYVLHYLSEKKTRFSFALRKNLSILRRVIRDLAPGMQK